MESSVIDTVQMAGTAPHSLSMFALFLQADIIVKAVMLALLGCSVWCWALIIDKSMRMRRLRGRADGFEERFWSGGSLDGLYDSIGADPADPMSAIFVAGMKEWRQGTQKGLPKSAELKASLQQRIERVMQVTMDRELADVSKQMTFLASLGSTAPFIGLFATVWGIMNSFQSIAASNNTSLAVVAPGIAEALFATAMGLVAAIPAVLAYNKFSSDIGHYTDRLDNFSIEFSAILGRYLEERA
ncbi:protein TolQ [Radicibacter daui]|uniref:protein TolQ n=1 Tax=Radicibacter daui TaxID=3064829 RepID=UPI004046F68D